MGHPERHANTSDADVFGLLDSLLGYLQLSDGTPSVKFQASLNDLYRHLQAPGRPAPRGILRERLLARLHDLPADSPLLPAGTPVEDTQAARVVRLALDGLPEAYRAFHRDLLFHLSDDDLHTSFFLCRLIEATLQNLGAAGDAAIIDAAMTSLNDYVGYRPVATLENGRRSDVDPHEKCRPIPICLRGVGPACGPDEPLLARTLEILRQADPDVQAQASFVLDHMDELALDPRAYDHAHPVNLRPGYQFGQWDPHHIDAAGHYRRFILQPMVLEGIREWLALRAEQSPETDPEEFLFEAAASLAGTILLSAGVSGGGPGDHSSDVTLATLVPQVARNRDRFYDTLMAGLQGPLARRLAAEAKKYRQPLGNVRQFLNQRITRLRSEQLRNDHIARIHAALGRPEASREQAAAIPTPSVRLRCELSNTLTAVDHATRAGDTSSLPGRLAHAEDLLRRAIGCGALIDPWNIIGFQGNFSLFPSLENSTFDPRTDELFQIMRGLLEGYARALRSAAAAGDGAAEAKLRDQLLALAPWWDAFGTTVVEEFDRLSGRELAESALFVAAALADWRQAGAQAGDVSFWHGHIDGFHTAQAYGAVLRALLDEGDFVAAMALLMHWLSRSEEVALEDGNDSFHAVAAEWMDHVCRRCETGPPGERSRDDDVPDDDVREGDVREGDVREGDVPDGAERDDRPPYALILKFFDYLESNADHLWSVPAFDAGDLKAPAGEELLAAGGEVVEDDEEDDVFSAAWEGVTYRDSTDDGIEGETIPEEGAGGIDAGPLASRAEELRGRLRFVETLAGLWRRVAASPCAPPADAGAAGSPEHGALPQRWQGSMRSWATRAAANLADLTALLHQVHGYRIPKTSGDVSAAVEVERLRQVKETLVHHVLQTALETAVASLLLDSRPEVGAAAGAGDDHDDVARWRPRATTILRAVHAGDTAAVAELLPDFCDAIGKVRILYAPLDRGGNPDAVFRTRFLRDVLKLLCRELPRLGMFRETYHLLEAVLEAESSQQASGPCVTEFNHLFTDAFQCVVRRLVQAMRHWQADGELGDESSQVVAELIRRFSVLWQRHTAGVRLSELEADPHGGWPGLTDFIKTYGRELFTPRFMNYPSLRGVLHQGPGNYLRHLVEQRDPLDDGRLAGDVGDRISLTDASLQLEYVLRCVIENYDVYKDYNAVSMQSDYGDNLYMLLDLLRLKAEYDRQRWEFQPVYLAHQALTRHGGRTAAERLAKAFRKETAAGSESLVRRLAGKEAEYGLRLPSVTDRVAERFTRPLDLNWLLALVEPSAARPEHGAAVAGEADESFALFRKDLNAFAGATVGTGLDVPEWLRLLEAEVHRVVSGRPSAADPPRKTVRLCKEDLDRQLADWDRGHG